MRCSKLLSPLHIAIAWRPTFLSDERIPPVSELETDDFRAEKNSDFGTESEFIAFSLHTHIILRGCQKWKDADESMIQSPPTRNRGARRAERGRLFTFLCLSRSSETKHSNCHTCEVLPNLSRVEEKKCSRKCAMGDRLSWDSGRQVPGPP